MFAGSYECLIVPNMATAEVSFRASIRDVREFLRFTPAGIRAERTYGQSLQRLPLGQAAEVHGGEERHNSERPGLLPLRTKVAIERYFPQSLR